jgi:hypothetical protein
MALQCGMEGSACLKIASFLTVQIAQQQQQQNSILSQASWDRLEMKPKRDEK